MLARLLGNDLEIYITLSLTSYAPGANNRNVLTGLL